MSNYLIELSGIHIALILGYWFFLRNERQYAKMRFYLLASTLLALIIPLIKLPRIFPVSTEAAHLVVLPLEVVTAAPAATTPGNYDLLLWVYVGVSGLLLIKFCISLLHLVNLARASKPENFNGVTIRKVRQVKGSFTFFNWIFLGDDIDKDIRDYDVIINHEKAHASLGHSFDIIAVELFKVCFWYLPTAWFINREIRKIHEYQADAHALASCNVDRYSSVLIRSTLQTNGLTLANSFHENFILKRLSAMRLPARNVSLWKSGALTALGLALFVAFACREEPAQGVESETNQSATAQGDIFVIVESLPEFEGGLEALNAYVIGELKYPSQARKMGIEGRVDVQFIVEKDGSLSNVKSVKGIGAGCDAEAVRVIQNAPPFKPGTQQGKPVRVRMEVPILFQLDKSEAVSSPDKSVIGSLQTRNNQFKVEGKYASGEWTGTVYDEEGHPLPGVNIIVAGTTSGTVSDLNGHFKIKAGESEVLNLSFVGYESVRLGGK